MDPEAHEAVADAPRAEPRWPILLAVLVVMVLSLVRPEEMRLPPRWVLPVVEVVLLATVLYRHPAHLGPRAALLRSVAICAVAIVLADTLLTAARLVDVLIHGGQTTNSADALLAAGAIVWGSNVISFALLYWLVDGGGAAARHHRMPTVLDLAFPQQLSPEVAPPGWRPHFPDYLFLGLTASTALATQSLVSIAVLGLVVARAVNVLN